MKLFIFRPPDGASVIGHGPGNRLTCPPGGLALLSEDTAARVLKAHPKSLTLIDPVQLLAVTKAAGFKNVRPGPSGDQARALWAIKHGVAVEALEADDARDARREALAMTIPALKELAKKNGIDLSGKTLKADIVDALFDAEG